MEGLQQGSHITHPANLELFPLLPTTNHRGLAGEWHDALLASDWVMFDTGRSRTDVP